MKIDRRDVAKLWPSSKFLVKVSDARSDKAPNFMSLYPLQGGGGDKRELKQNRANNKAEKKHNQIPTSACRHRDLDGPLPHPLHCMAYF